MPVEFNPGGSANITDAIRDRLAALAGTSRLTADAVKDGATNLFLVQPERDKLGNVTVTGAVNLDTDFAPVAHGHDAAAITTGQFGTARVADGAITTAKLATGPLTSFAGLPPTNNRLLWYNGTSTLALTAASNYAITLFAAGDEATWKTILNLENADLVAGVSAALGGTGWQSSNQTTEELQDLVAAMFQGGTHTNASIAYDDVGGFINITASGGGGGAPLTQEQVEDFVANLTTAGTGISVTYDDVSNTLTFALTGESFTTALLTKLNGIEAGADVTDAANVAAAGAVMTTDLDAAGDLPLTEAVTGSDIALFGNVSDSNDIYGRTWDNLTADLGIAKVASPALTYAEVVVSASRALALTDLGKVLRPSATATITIPANATVAIPVGSMIPLAVPTGITCTITAASGVTANGITGSAVVDAAAAGVVSGVTLWKHGTDAWTVIGAIGAFS